MSLQHKFEYIVSSPLNLLTCEDLKPIALGFWYENYTPEVKEMNSVELCRAGYLIDLLMSFNCVSDDRQLELMKLTQKIEQSLSNLKLDLVAVGDRNSSDPIALKWGLNEDIFAALQPLLKYQTRHYVHS